MKCKAILEGYSHWAFRNWSVIVKIRTSQWCIQIFVTGIVFLNSVFSYAPFSSPCSVKCSLTPVLFVLLSSVNQCSDRQRCLPGGCSGVHTVRGERRITGAITVLSLKLLMVITCCNIWSLYFSNGPKGYYF